MEEKLYYVGTSFLFAAGIAIGVAATTCLTFTTTTLCSTSLCLLIARIAVMIGLWEKPSRLLPMLLFMLLGVFCAINSSLLEGLIFRQKNAVLEKLAESLKMMIDSIPFKHDSSNSLVKALVSGDRTDLGNDLRDSFRKAGASHILALSGMHLGIIYLLIRRPLSMLGGSRTATIIRFALTITAAGLFTLVTGAGASLVRAFLFILFSETATLIPERRTDLKRSLAAALLLQLALKPQLIQDVGFQLSYLAMSGIAFLMPELQSWYPEGKCGMKKLWDSMALSLSCQLFTAPAVWFYFQSFPPFFLLTNLLAMPLTTAVMGSSVLCLVLEGAGICPNFIIQSCDFLIQVLIFVLETISEL